MTRIEKIRKMTSEELANEMCENYDNHCPFCAYREHSCTEIDCIDGIKMWLEAEVELTADEMLKELGYEINHNTNGYLVYENTSLQVCDSPKKLRFVLREGEWKYSVFYNYEIMEIAEIGEAEYRAIHKKIEELKNDKQ